MREQYKCLTTLIKLYLTCICIFVVVKPAEQMYYFSKEDCMDDVQDLPVCGKVSTIAFHYNFITKACEEVPYRGCSPTRNNFDTLEQCNHFAVRICSTIRMFGKEDCHQAPQPCKFGLPRGFQFDVKHEECRPVIMGDCSQSTNYFKTMHDCHRIVHLVCNISFEDDSNENKVTTILPSTTDHTDHSKYTKYWTHMENYNESTTDGTITSTGLETESTDDSTSETLMTTTVTPSPFQESFIIQVIKSFIMGHYGQTSLIGQLLQKLLGISSTNCGDCNDIGLGSIILSIGKFLARTGLLKLSLILYWTVALPLKVIKTIIFFMSSGRGCGFCTGSIIPSIGKLFVRMGLLNLSHALYWTVALPLKVTKTIIFFMSRRRGCRFCHHYRPPAFRRHSRRHHQEPAWMKYYFGNIKDQILDYNDE